MTSVEYVVKESELSVEAPQTRHPTSDFGADGALSLAIFGLTLAYLVLFRRYTAIEPDEGIILQGAERILGGQVLYRDFFSYFTPGSYYLLALLFKVFGSSMLAARITLAVYGGFFSVFTYAVAQRVCSRWSALATAYLVTITCLPWRFLVLHNWDSTLLACAAIYCAMRWLEAKNVNPKGHGEQSAPKAEARREKADRNTDTAAARLSYTIGSPLNTRHSSLRWWAFATGSFVSLTALFEQSKGAGLALGLGIGFVILALAGKSQKAEVRKQKPEDRRPKAETRSEGPSSSLITGHSSLSLCVGLAWPFLLTFAYFGAHHAFSQMLADWLWPLHHYSRANAVPYGYQNWSDEARRAMFGGGIVRGVLSAFLIGPCFVLPVLPLIALGFLAYLVTAGARARISFNRWRYYVLVCGAISGLLVSIIASRADILHFVYLGPLLYLVIAWFLGSGDFQIRLAHPLTRISHGDERKGGVSTPPSACAPEFPQYSLAERFVFDEPFSEGNKILRKRSSSAGLKPRPSAASSHPGEEVGLKQLFGGFLVLCFTLLAMAFLLTARGAHFNLNTRRGLVETSRLDEVIPYTQAYVPAGSKIFIYPYRPLYYYLTATYNPTRFEYLQPGMHTRQQNEEAIYEIEASRTRVVLFELGFNQKIAVSWPNTPIQDIANDPVGDYILAHYRSCRVLKSAAGGRFLFMVRKDLVCPN